MYLYTDVHIHMAPPNRCTEHVVHTHRCAEYVILHTSHRYAQHIIPMYRYDTMCIVLSTHTAILATEALVFLALFME